MADRPIRLKALGGGYRLEGRSYFGDRDGVHDVRCLIAMGDTITTGRNDMVMIKLSCALTEFFGGIARLEARARLAPYQALQREVTRIGAELGEDEIDVEEAIARLGDADSRFFDSLDALKGVPRG